MSNNFQESVDRYKQFLASPEAYNPNKELNKHIQRIGSINTPILQRPSLTAQSTTNKMKKGALGGRNMFFDRTTNEYYLLKKLDGGNQWVSWVTHVIAFLTINTTPDFYFKSDKESRDKTFIQRMTNKLKNPNRNETWFDIAYKAMYSVVLFGDAYWQKVYDNSGKLHSIYSIPTDTIRPIPYIDENGILRFVYVQLATPDGYNYNVSRVFDDTEIIRFTKPNPHNMLYGRSTYASLFDNLSFDNETKSYMNNYLENSFSGGMVFEMKNSHKDIVERNRQELIENLSGAKNAGRNMILEGEVRLVNDGNKAKEFPFRELRNKNSDEIVACAGLPLSVAGLRSDNGSINAELIDGEELAALRNTVHFYQRILQKGINLHLIRNSEENTTTEFFLGVNNNFALKNSQNIVDGLLKVGARPNEMRKILGASEVKDEFGETLVIGTNNGAIPVEQFLANMKNEAKLKEIRVEQETKKTALIGKEDVDMETSDSDDDGESIAPKLKVNPETGTTEILTEE